MKTRNVELYGVTAVLATFTEDENENVIGGPTFSAPYLTDASVLWDMAETGGWDTDAEEWVSVPHDVTMPASTASTADVTAMDDLARLLKYGLAGDGTWDGAADHLDALAAIVRRVRPDLDAEAVDA